MVLPYFGMNYPASRTSLSADGAPGVFLLAVMANVAYCAVYVVDLFAQVSGYRDLWREYRWVLFLIWALSPEP